MLILNICFIKFSLCHEKLRSWKNCLILENRGKNLLKVIESYRKSHHQIQSIKKPCWGSFKLLSTIYFFSFFFHGWSYRISGPRMSREGSFWRKLKVLVPSLSDRKIGGRLGPLSRPFPPNSPDQNSEKAILFTIVEKPSNYVFKDDLLPHSPRCRGCKLETLNCVYI